MVIEDDVEIGANTCIDRSSMDGHTTLHRGVKLDNLIQIAHNVTVGEDTAIAAQCGIAGSAHIGKNCMFGGQTGIVGHLSIADGTLLGARAGVSRSLKTGTYEGYPAIPSTQFRKAYVLFRNFPEIYQEITSLKKEVEELKKELKKK